MSQANKGEPWRQAMNDQIAAAAEHPELEVVFADAAQNNAKQVADVENFLPQGIDLLIISPNEAAPLTDVVAEAYAQGVPVIVLDRKVNGDQFTMWIGADNMQIGGRPGSTPRSTAPSRDTTCNVLEIRGLEGSTPAKERGDGFREGIAATPLSRSSPARTPTGCGKGDPGLAGNVPGQSGGPRRLRPQRPDDGGGDHLRGERRAGPRRRSSSSVSTPCRPPTAASGR